MKDKNQKFQIGQKVFYIDNNKFQEGIVQGVCATYEPDFQSKKSQVFKKFIYYFDKRINPESYSWTSEDLIFATKEDYVNYITEKV